LLLSIIVSEKSSSKRTRERRPTQTLMLTAARTSVRRRFFRRQPDICLFFGKRSRTRLFFYKGCNPMPNGRVHDNPLSDFTIHGLRPFPPDIMDLLERIEAAGRKPDRWPLGENWPYSPREFAWERGEYLEGARRDLAHLLEMLEAGRGDEVLLDPRTGKPFMQP
jgi:hypothetical protein